jgi:hypothetical protein
MKDIATDYLLISPVFINIVLFLYEKNTFVKKNTWVFVGIESAGLGHNKKAK